LAALGPEGRFESADVVALYNNARIPFDPIDRMKKNLARKESGERRPYRVRLSGFLSEEEVGLGDLIKRATNAIGIRPCAGCERRAAALNRWFVFTGWHSR